MIIFHSFGDVTIAGWDSNTQPSAYGANALTDCTTAAANIVCRLNIISKTFILKVMSDGLDVKYVSV